MSEEQRQKALEEIEYIKEVISGAGQFTNISGVSWIVAGVLALVGVGVSYFLTHQFSFRNLGEGETLYLGALWGGLLLLAISFDYFMVSRTSRMKNVPDYYRSSFSALSRKLRLLFFVTLLVGGAFTFQYLLEGTFYLAPTAWMMIFGLALVMGGLFSLKIVPWVGAWFLIIGFVFSTAFPDFTLLGLGLTFGVGLITGGVVIKRENCREKEE